METHVIVLILVCAILAALLLRYGKDFLRIGAGTSLFALRTHESNPDTSRGISGGVDEPPLLGEKKTAGYEAIRSFLNRYGMNAIDARKSWRDAAADAALRMLNMPINPKVVRNDDELKSFQRESSQTLNAVGKLWGSDTQRRSNPFHKLILQLRDKSTVRDINYSNLESFAKFNRDVYMIMNKYHNDGLELLSSIAVNENQNIE